MADNNTSITITAIDKTEAALKNIQGNVSNLEGGFSRLSGVVSGFAALAGVTAFAGIVKGAVDSAAGLHDMAQQTGATVESLSAMRGAAKIAGVDLDQVAGGLTKLSKNMLQAAQGSGDASKVFSALGISVTDANGKMKSSDAVMLEFSKGLQTVGSSSERAAAAQLVLGKNGAALMPLLNDLAVSGSLNAKITAEQAAAADNLQDNMTRLSTVGQAWKTTVAMEVVPAANAFVEALLEVSTQADGTKRTAKDLASDGSIKEWAIGAAKTAGFVVDAFDGVVRTVKLAGTSIAAIAAQGAMIASGNFSGAAAVRDEWTKNVEGIINKEQFSDVLARRIAEIGKVAPEAAAGATSLAGALKALEKGSNDAAKSLENLHNQQMVRLGKQAEAELDGIEKANAKYQDYLDARLGGIAGETESLLQKAKASELELQTIGLTADQLAVVTAKRYDEQIAIKQAEVDRLTGIAGREGEVYAIEQQIDALRRLQSAEIAKPKLQAQAREWEKFTDQINQSLTDALFRSFESGESFGKSFAKNLENTFKTMALKFAINYVVNGAGQLVGAAGNSAINAVLGTVGNNGGSGTDYLGIANSASSLNTAYNLYNGTYLANAQGAYNTYVAGSSAFGYTAPYWGTTAGTALANAATPTAAGYGMSVAPTSYGYGMSVAPTTSSTAPVSSASGISAGYLAIIAGWLMSSQAWKEGIRWDNTYGPTNEPLKAGAHGSMHEGQYRFNEWIGGKDFAESEFMQTITFSALSQSLNKMIWGSGYQSTGISSLRGTFSEDNKGFSNGQAGMELRSAGGWFGSADNKVEWGGVSDSFESMLSAIYISIRETYLNIGDIFDDQTLEGKLTGFVQNIYHSNTTDMKASLNLMSEVLSQEMGGLLFPSIAALKKSASTDGKVAAESWSQAFGRIVQESQAVSRIFDLMGKNLVDVFGKNNADGILKASDNLVTLFGTIDNLNTSFASYYSNFYTQAEQSAQAWEDMGKAFSAIGLETPKTREGFRALVDGLDMTTLTGMTTYKSLLDLSKGFAELVPVMEDTAAATKAATDTAKANQASMLESLVPANQLTVLTTGFAALGLAVPKTNQQFWNLVKSADGATAAGQSLLTSLEGLLPAFNSVQGAVDAIANEQASIYGKIFDAQLSGMTKEGQIAAMKAKETGLWSALNAGDVSLAEELSTTILQRIALEAEANTAQRDAASAQLDTMKRLRDFAVDMHNTVLSLKAGDLSPLSYIDQLNAAQQQWQETLTLARSGDQQAQGSLSSVGQNYLQEAKSYYGANSDYAATFSSVTGSLDQFSSSSPTEIQIDNQTALITQMTTTASNSAEQVAQLKRIAEALGVQQDTMDGQGQQATSGTVALIARLEALLDRVDAIEATNRVAATA